LNNLNYIITFKIKFQIKILNMTSAVAAQPFQNSTKSKFP